MSTMKRFTSRLRSAFAPDGGESVAPPRRAVESAQDVDLFGPTLSPIPQPISSQQSGRRSEFERARTRSKAIKQVKVEVAPASPAASTRKGSVINVADVNDIVVPIRTSESSTGSSVPVYRTPSHHSQESSHSPLQTHAPLFAAAAVASTVTTAEPATPARNASVSHAAPPAWSDSRLVPPTLEHFSFPTPTPTASSPKQADSASPLSNQASLRTRHSVKFSLPTPKSSPQIERVEVAPTESEPTSTTTPSRDSSDSLFSTTEAGTANPDPSMYLVSPLDPVPPKAGARRSVPQAPTSVVRWAVDNEKEYELSKSVDKDVLFDALENQQLVREFREYFDAHDGDSALLNLYIDLREFSSQSTVLRTAASSILSTYFNPQSPSRLYLPISLRGPIIHSLAPLSGTLLALETAEQDLFAKIHADHFEGFTQERLIGMAVEWMKKVESSPASPADKNQEQADESSVRLFLPLEAVSEALTDDWKGRSMWDNPMVCLSKGFAELTGYEVKEIVGLNCRVFQGPCTSQSSHLALRQAIYGETPITKLVLNYRRNGEPFYNLIQIIPIKNELGETEYFLGGVNDVTDLLHPFSTKAPKRAADGGPPETPSQIYSRILLARPGSRKIVYSSPEVAELLGYATATSLIGLDLLNLLSPPASTGSPLLGSPPREDKEPVTVQQSIAAAIRRGDTWKGEVELDCRGEEDVDAVGSAAPVTTQKTTKCVLYVTPLFNQEGKPKMLVVILA
ncbi:hypothetical protein JCM10212_005010 [Sporobolomyces blumeae]